MFQQRFVTSLSQSQHSSSPNTSLSQSHHSSSPNTNEDKNYVGIETLQEQIKTKALRKGFVFNLMIAGRSGLGKSTLVKTLFKTELSRNSSQDSEGKIPPTTQIRSVCCDLFEKGVKLSLTVTDTPGFGDQVNNTNCWEPLVEYIERQFQSYLEEERKLQRKFRPKDTRIHCCLYFIQPSGHALNSLDIEVMKRLCSIVNVIPVIAKADTLTNEERKSFKERIRADLLDHDVEIYPLKEFEDEEDVADNNKIREMMPFAVIGSTLYHEVHGRKVLGRKTNWGVVEVENKNHCDFPILRDLLIRNKMADLIEVTSSHYYEEFRKRFLSKEEKENPEE
ncbi:UNVERIFIED_CONTAM: hypothetical protein RMT77_002574 [Armadillidium vulgare]